MNKKLILAFALMLINANTFAQELPEIIDSGTCGETAEDCSWHYENGRLTITGTGEMTDYNNSSAKPWDQWRNNITEIEMSGITKIGKYAFWLLTEVEEVTIPATVKELGFLSIAHMDKLNKVDFEKDSNLEKLDWGVFEHDINLTVLEIPETVKSISGDELFDSGVMSLVLPKGVFEKNGELSGDALHSGMTIYCPQEHQQKCEEYLKTAREPKGSDSQGYTIRGPLQNMTLRTYEKDGDGYFINGSWYKHPNDVLTGKRIKKLRYTIEEAMKATAHGDKFHVSLTYK